MWAASHPSLIAGKPQPVNVFQQGNLGKSPGGTEEFASHEDTLSPKQDHGLASRVKNASRLGSQTGGSNRSRNAPKSAPRESSSSGKRAIAPCEGRVSEWRKRRTSPRAIPAPRFI